MASASSTYRTNYPLPSISKPFSGAAVTLKTWQASEAEFAKIAACGIKYIRINLWWKYVEPIKGARVFTAYDNYLAWADKYGMRLNFIFDTANSNYGNTTAEKLQPFTDYTAACVDHFRERGVLWEIINEPDVLGLPVDEFMALCHSSSQAIRATSSQEWILGPSVSSISLDSAKAYMKGCLDRGVLDDVDVVTVHPYIHDAPETISGPFSALRTQLKAYPGGSTKPIFASEWGYPSFELPILLSPSAYTTGAPNLLADSNNFVSNDSWKGWYIKPNLVTGVADPVGGMDATRMMTADYVNGANVTGFSGLGQFGQLIKGDYYVASVWLRSTLGSQTVTLGLNDRDKISFVIDTHWRRYNFSFVVTDPWNQGRVLQIMEANRLNAAWEIYGAQLEHIGQLTPALIDQSQRNVQGGFLVRAYKACLAAKIPYMAMYEWQENPSMPGCGMTKVDGSPYPAYTFWKNYYLTNTGTPVKTK